MFNKIKQKRTFPTLQHIVTLVIIFQNPLFISFVIIIRSSHLIDCLYYPSQLYLSVNSHKFGFQVALLHNLYKNVNLYFSINYTLNGNIVAKVIIFHILFQTSLQTGSQLVYLTSEIYADKHSIEPLVIFCYYTWFLNDVETG